MRIYSHWVCIERTIDIGGAAQRVRVFGGSNQSETAAATDAENRLARMLDGIGRGRRRDDSYEADIREEILTRIDERNVVTRNRYGAEVLNSENVIFVDIDKPRLTFREAIFGRDRNVDNAKARIVAALRKLASDKAQSRLGLRLYETHKGIRAIVDGSESPKADTTRKFMRTLGADGLYATLCARQGCYRARLTPKPYRMHCKTHRVVFPRLDEKAEAEFRLWLAEYETKRHAFATCKYLETIGPDFRNAVIDYHDKATGAFSGRPLA